MRKQHFATTIAERNFNIMQKRAFTQRHTRENEIITKARKPNHVFRSRVGLSAHIHTIDILAR